MTHSHKIAFLFLDEIHHVNHFVSVAVALAEKNEVHILTYPGKHSYLRNALQKLQGEKVIVEELKTLPFRAFTDKLKKRELPRKGFWLKKNMKYLLHNFDALIFTDFFHRYVLDARHNKTKPKLIKFTHGTPGRGYTFKNDMVEFDFQLLPGNFYKQLLEEKNLLAQNYAVVGYPKLDAVQRKETPDFFSNNKPIILYNPHFAEPLSSWHLWGLKLLDWFYHQNTYNLIFAPHINLFEHKGGASPETIPEKYFKAEHMHIDLGSEESVDMTYIMAADLYLGDVSSQVYEFITTPRPCVFLNPQQIDHAKDVKFRFWKCGPVLTAVEALPSSLENAFEDFNKFKSVQEHITSENYYTEEGSSPSQRAAKAITAYLDTTSL
ncbi:MAG: hypothetical protein CMC70_01980 [Flavobacteriaceae bacterium]|nr:hypothetical protein [Flavobacteriaceae bacterium]